VIGRSEFKGHGSQLARSRHHLAADCFCGTWINKYSIVCGVELIVNAGQELNLHLFH